MAEELTAEAEARIRASFARGYFTDYLGMQLERIEYGRAEVYLPFRPLFKQAGGVVHGGVIFALADQATAMATLSVLPLDRGTTTVEMKLNFLKGVQEGNLRAVGAVRRRGGRVVVAAADVFDETGDLVATGLATLLVLRGKG
ncbi:MAG: PaaI family thioesterase [Clostridia bacterium]|nr:PaaI family thioesterase [Clostridia bacterium]